MIPRRSVPSAGLLFVFVFLSACAVPDPTPNAPRNTPPDTTRGEMISDGRVAMGTVLEISVFGTDAGRAREFIDRSFADVARLEAILSSWDPESALSKLNAASANSAAPVSAIVPFELAEVLAAALTASESSDGAFDVTAGPLIQLFREAREKGRAPDDAAIAESLARTGYRYLTVSKQHSVSFERAGMRVELGAIAKGFALDRLAESWRRSPAGSALLLSLGQSSMLAIGAPGDVPGWRLKLRSKLTGAPELGEVVLRDRALSMSSSVSDSPTPDEDVVSHIIDPRTGRPIESQIDVVVIAESAAVADAVSTAVVVMGVGDGMRLIERMDGVEGMVVGDDVGVVRSSGF